MTESFKAKIHANTYIFIYNIYFDIWPEFLSSVPQDLLLKMNANSIFASIGQIHEFVHAMNRYAFENSNVQKLIHSTDFQFDVIINEEFFADSFLMFAHKYEAPIITMCEYNGLVQ